MEIEGIGKISGIRRNQNHHRSAPTDLLIGVFLFPVLQIENLPFQGLLNYQVISECQKSGNSKFKGWSHKPHTT
jgi:hypothetical protein